MTAWVESSRVQNVIVGLIVLNAITLGLETSDAVVERFGLALQVFEVLVLAVFVIEILIKLYCYRLELLSQRLESDGFRDRRRSRWCRTSGPLRDPAQPADSAGACGSCRPCQAIAAI